MKKHFLLIAAAFAAFILLTGNTDAVDVNRMIFVAGIGIDRADDGYRYTFYIAVPVGSDNTVSENSVEYHPTVINADNMAQAVRILERNSSRDISLEHLNCTALGSSVLNEDITAILEFLLRDPTSRRQCTLLALDNSAEEFFSVKYDGSIAARAAALVEQQDDSGKTTMTLGRLSSYSASGSGMCIYILDVPVSGETSSADLSSPADLHISGLALFENGLFSGRLSADQAELARLFITGQASGIITTVDERGRKYHYEITYSKCSTDFQPGIPSRGSFEITVECMLIDSEGKGGPYPDEEELSEALHAQLWELLTLARNNGSAFTGLETEAMESHRKWYHNHIGNWKNIYSSAILDLEVSCKIERRSD